MTTLQELTERVTEAVGEDSGLGKSFKVDLRGEGFIHIEGGAVSNDDKPADLTVSIDGGCGFGGTLAAGCFDAAGEMVDLIEV